MKSIIAHTRSTLMAGAFVYAPPETGPKATALIDSTTRFASSEAISVAE